MSPLGRLMALSDGIAEGSEGSTCADPVMVLFLCVWAVVSSIAIAAVTVS